MGELKSRTPISWNEYFMGAAYLTSLRSKDPSSQVGATFVKNKRIIGLGYNGFPQGIRDADLPWTRGAKDTPKHKTKYPYITHAEPNGIINRIESLENSTAYISFLPCTSCAPILLTYGVSEVVFNSSKYVDEPNMILAKKWLEDLGVKVSQWHSDKPITLDMMFDNTEKIEYDRQKRESHNPDENPNFTSWDTCFMSLANLTALRSKDPKKQEGACLINSDNRILATGYNGLPGGRNGIDFDETFDWDLPLESEERKIVVPAIINLLANAPIRSHYSTLYTTHFPNPSETRILIPQGIREVVYGFESENTSNDIASKKMLELAGINVKKYTPQVKDITIDLSSSVKGEKGGKCSF